MVVKYQFPTKQINERLKTQAPESGVIKNLLENLSTKMKFFLSNKNEVRKSKCCIL